MGEVPKQASAIILVQNTWEKSPLLPPQRHQFGPAGAPLAPGGMDTGGECTKPSAEWGGQA